MAIKKKTATGPKAKLMKKNLTQLKAQAKRLKIKGFSTKKKDALVKSIMMAEARKQKSKAPKKSMGASGSMKRMVKKRGAMPDRVMKKPVRPGVRKRNKPGMAGVEYAEFKGFGYRELSEAATLLKLYSEGRLSRLARDFFSGPYGISVGFNDMSGNVFLVDEDFNVLMDDGAELELFITTPYSRQEGFYDDLMEMYDDLDEEDQEYLDSLK